MKKIPYFILVALLFCTCEKPEKQEGSIIGIVSNEVEHELQRAKITLLDNSGKMEVTETGSDGQYEFLNLSLNTNYTIIVELSGYYSDTILTKVDKMEVRCDFVLKEIALRVSSTYIDASNNNYADFIIYNDSQREMAYLIEKNVSWLTLSKTSGLIQAKGAEPIHITIDRSQIPSGTQSTKIVVNSSHEYAEIALNIAKDPTLNTLDITDVTTTSAVLHGMISDIGAPAYTERGFCYSSANQEPSITDLYILSEGNGVTGSFSDTIKNLSPNTIYYIRTFAKDGNNITYGNTKQFRTKQKPTIAIADYLAISNGVVVTYNFSSNATILYQYLYTQETLPSSDEAIIVNLKTKEINIADNDWLYYVYDNWDGINIAANRTYFWCAIVEDASGNSSSLLKLPIQTPTNIVVPKAIHTKKSLSEGVLVVDITKTSSCYSYVSICQELDNDTDMNLPDIIFAWTCYKHPEWIQYENLTDYQFQTDIQSNKTYAIYSLGYYSGGENSGQIDKHFFNRTQWDIQPNKSYIVPQNKIQKLPNDFMKRKTIKLVTVMR